MVHTRIGDGMSPESINRWIHREQNAINLRLRPVRRSERKELFAGIVITLGVVALVAAATIMLYRGHAAWLFQ